MLVHLLTVVLFQAASPGTVPSSAVPGGVAASGAATVSPEVVCAVQRAVRWREEAWTEEECRARERDYADAGLRWNLLPVQLMAISIVESDLRVRAQRVVGRKLDLGLMGVRCVLGLRRRGRCANWPVRGLTPTQVMEPRRNIEKGAEIMAELHHGDLSSYNSGHKGGTRYPAKVAAIVSALGGIETRVVGKRLRKLVNQIAKVVREKRTS